MSKENKELALTLIKKAYNMVKNDKCDPTDESINLLRKMCVRKLNKTQAAKYIGVSVSTFNKLVAGGLISQGTKEANECLKWQTDELDEYIEFRR